MRIRILFSLAVVVVAGVSSSAWAQAGGEFEITASTIVGGGGVSRAGEFELTGRLGQSEAGQSSGGEFELAGGFFFAVPPGDCDADGDVDLADFLVFQECFTGSGSGAAMPGCGCSDFDGDRDVDLGDLIAFQAHFTGAR